MTGRILFLLAFPALLVLGACQTLETASSATVAPDLTGWRLASGKSPTEAEFAALTATCEDQPKGAALDSCLATIGLKKVQ